MMKRNLLFIQSLVMSGVLIGLVGGPAFAAPGPPGNHVNISEVQVDLSIVGAETVTILGEDFDFGGPLAVTLAGMELTIDSGLTDVSQGRIVAALPGVLTAPGEYLLVVSTGNGQSQNDEYDLTIGIGGGGSQGPQGKLGPQGDPGAQGMQGKVGPGGPPGDQGPQGKIGPAGADGADGNQGPQGKIGLTGDPGPQGPQGKIGPGGADGAQGVQGKVGPGGPPGDQGPQGKIGPAGADGAQGPQGKVGPAGPPGAEGADGAQGPQGKIGSQGPQGKQGPEGPQGPQTVVGLLTNSNNGASTTFLAGESVQMTATCPNSHPFAVAGGCTVPPSFAGSIEINAHYPEAVTVAPGWFFCSFTNISTATVTATVTVRAVCGK